MSDNFDDMPDGAGKRATEEDYSRVWRYMASRNRKPSVRTVLLELAAQNYIPPAVATSARWAKKLGLSLTEFEAIVAQPAHHFSEFPNHQRKRRLAVLAYRTAKSVLAPLRLVLTRTGKSQA